MDRDVAHQVAQRIYDRYGARILGLSKVAMDDVMRFASATDPAVGEELRAIIAEQRSKITKAV